MRPALTALLNQDGGHPAVGTVGKIAAGMRAEKIVLFTGLWIFSIPWTGEPKCRVGDRRRSDAVERPHSHSKEAARNIAWHTQTSLLHSL